MKKEIKEFNKYVKNYDLKNKNIMVKYHHSFRVMEFCKEIAYSLNLTENDIYIASLCGLLHDIARFEQWTKYQTYIDNISFDHGDRGEEILKEIITNFTNDKEIINIILNCTKYHNKAYYPKLDERNHLFVTIVRDADKLDIITEQGNTINQDKIELKSELLESIYNKEICKNEFVKTDVDSILRMLSWIFDLNYDYSYQYLINKKIIEKKLNLLEIYGINEELIKLRKWIEDNIRKGALNGKNNY